jgi:hypothetical protein
MSRRNRSSGQRRSSILPRRLSPWRTANSPWTAARLTENEGTLRKANSASTASRLPSAASRATPSTAVVRRTVSSPTVEKECGLSLSSGGIGVSTTLRKKGNEAVWSNSDAA